MTTPLPSGDDLARLLAGAHHDPHGLLGAHQQNGGTVLRTRQPLFSSSAIQYPAT